MLSPLRAELVRAHVGKLARNIPDDQIEAIRTGHQQVYELLPDGDAKDEVGIAAGILLEEIVRRRASK